MFSVLRRRMSYANVVATLAMVFAMSGGAYAASKFLITSTKQIKPSVLASLKGAAGKPGPAGVQGAAGPQGPAGAGGAQGAKGENGADGKEGAQGKEGLAGKEGKAGESVASTALAAKNANCVEGGSEFTVGGKHTYACNGSPWTAGGTLPPGKTETGTFASRIFVVNEGGIVSIPISFPIPVAPGATPRALFVGLSEIGTGTGNAETCTGSAENLTAPAEGVLCVYASTLKSKFIEATPTIGGICNNEPFCTYGTRVKFKIEGSKLEREAEPGHIEIEGVWAVTAPAP